MPALSKAQQRIMGMAYAYKKGDLPGAPSSVKKLADAMSLEQLRDFAATSTEGLPKKASTQDLVNIYTKVLIDRQVKQAKRDLTNKDLLSGAGGTALGAALAYLASHVTHARQPAGVRVAAGPLGAVVGGISGMMLGNRVQPDSVIASGGGALLGSLAGATGAHSLAMVGNKRGLPTLLGAHRVRKMQENNEPMNNEDMELAKLVAELDSIHKEMTSSADAGTRNRAAQRLEQIIDSNK